MTVSIMCNSDGTMDLDSIVDCSKVINNKQMDLDVLAEKITIAFKVELVSDNPIGYNQLEDYSYGCSFTTRHVSLGIINMKALRNISDDDYDDILSIVFRLVKEGVLQNLNLNIYISD